MKHTHAKYRNDTATLLLPTSPPQYRALEEFLHPALEEDGGRKFTSFPYQQKELGRSLNLFDFSKINRQ
jgi:hypothetical protein